MPPLSVWLIRAACVHLALGFTFGGLLLFHKGVPLHPLLWRLLPLHIESVLIGWTLQLAMGVAFWALPRYTLGPSRGGGSAAERNVRQLAAARFSNAPVARGDERPVVFAFALLNTGVLAVMAGSLLAEVEWLVLVGRAAELIAALLFARHAWPRVKVWGQ